MTMGTSAPPTGSTRRTPSSSPTRPRTTPIPVLGPVTVKTESPTAATNESANTTGSPGKTTGREVISSWSLAKVTSDPANDTDPTRMVNAVAASVKPGVAGLHVGELEQRDEGGRATADPVEQRDQLRHLGHLHAACADQPDRRTHGDRDEDRDDVVQLGVEEHHDAGEDRPEGADQVAGAGGARGREALEGEDEADGGEQVGELRPDGGGGHLAGLFRVNICSIRSVTTKPPTMFTVASTTATSPITSCRVLCA